MLHTNFQGHRLFGSGVEDFLRFLPYIGVIHVIFSQIGRSAIFGREIGVPDRQIFFAAKKYSSLMSKLVYLHHRRSL